MATENIVTGKKYRILKDATNKIWDVISFWTKASDVYNNNNQNLQTTVGGITGISSSLTSTASNVAASANAVKQLNDKITKLNSDLVQKVSLSLRIWGKDVSSYVDKSHTINATLTIKNKQATIDIGDACLMTVNRPCEIYLRDVRVEVID